MATPVCAFQRNFLCTWFRFDQDAVGMRLGAQPVADAPIPALEVAERSVDPGESFMGGPVAEDMGPVAVPRHRAAAAPAVGLDDRGRGGVAHSEVAEILGAAGPDRGQPSGGATFKTRAFARFADRERIGDSALCEAVPRARTRRGLVDADLGSGRSGGFRTIVRDRRGELALCACGFAKSGRENLRRDALETFPLPASEHLAMNPSGLAAELAVGAIVEATCDDRTVQERNAKLRRPGRGVAMVLTSLWKDPASGNQSSNNGRSEPGKSPSGMFLELPGDETDHRAGPGGRPVKCQCCRERQLPVG